MKQFSKFWIIIDSHWRESSAQRTMCGEWFKYKKSQWLVPLGTRSSCFHFHNLLTHTIIRPALSYVLNHLITVIHMLSPIRQKTQRRRVRARKLKERATLVTLYISSKKTSYSCKQRISHTRTYSSKRTFTRTAVSISKVQLATFQPRSEIKWGARNYTTTLCTHMCERVIIIVNISVRCVLETSARAHSYNKTHCCWAKSRCTR